MQESPGLKPDWLAKIKPFSRIESNILFYKSFQKFYCKFEVKTLDSSFLRFVCHLFYKLAQH